ncbi:MAG: thermonuclease family protein [Deltaproteobacteria bacterium]|nr:thermonuclease family protein [Deltaproteobacteria bacterium]
MAGHQGVAIAFICLFLLGLGQVRAVAGDTARSSPINDKSAAKPAPEGAGIQTPARVLSVTDGDAVKVNALMWPGLTWKGSVRVEGVDTPELGGRAKCEAEKRRAEAARDFVKERVGKRVTLVNVKNDKYAGRVVARIKLADGTDLTELLIQAKHGRPYNGGRRRGWCGQQGS